MDRIPVEIKLAIVGLLVDESPELAYTYATVSREWQAFIEPTTFASLKLDQGRLSQARETLTPARQAYVRQIQFTALLPNYHNQDKYRDSDSDKKHNNDAFSDAVVSLMEFLSIWSSSHDAGIELELRTACTVDLQDMTGGMIKVLRLPYRLERRERCVTSYVALLEGLCHQLPVVSSVTKFTCPPAFIIHRRLVPKTCCEIASRFPRLRTIDWDLEDGCHDDAFRLRLRNDFATSLSTLPGSVRNLTISYHSGPGPDRFFHIPDPRICPGVTRDPLSIALGRISMQLEEMSLRMTIGSELLWDPELPSDQQGHRPLLREIQLSSGCRTPQGEALFDWDDLSESDPDLDSGPRLDYERSIPIPAQFIPYQLAFSRAAGRMPNLKCLYVTLGDRLGAFENYTVQPGRCADRGPRAEFIYEGASVTMDHITQEIQDEWWNTAQVHLREGGEFHFEVVEDMELFKFRHCREVGQVSRPKPPEEKVIEWTRVI